MKPDYSKSKIFKLVSEQALEDGGRIYIGSTTLDLKVRLSKLISQYRKYMSCVSNRDAGVSGADAADTATRIDPYFVVMCYDDAKIELVEEYPCENKGELRAREIEVAKQFEEAGQPVIYKETNLLTDPAHKRQYHRRYYEAHKERLLAQSKRNYVHRRPCNCCDHHRVPLARQ